MRFSTIVAFLAAAWVYDFRYFNHSRLASEAEMKTFGSEFDGHIEVHKLTKITPTSDVPTMRYVTLPIETRTRMHFLQASQVLT
ncbi:hypothetical protein BGX30_009355 [Mortierella sp. GBA39]|nr:hypothetical protein BGX30_009355 [Mortierella sp. GBA39]